jgi:GTPase SAR1 family protein
MPMMNAREARINPKHRILVAGPTGSGKSTQIWSLPGKKFAYVFDPNTIPTIRGCDVDYEEFFPEVQEMDLTLKGFNRGSKSDKPRRPREPTVYNDFCENFNDKWDAKFFDNYDWLILDSVTFLSRACMDRTLYLNGRFGDLEDISDYRVVGSKLTDVFNSITSLPCHVYCTGHINVYQSDKTKKVTTEIWLPGKARNILPLMMTNVWLSKCEENSDGELRYYVRTKPEPRGLLDIRTCIPNLDTEEDVTLDLRKPGSGGIGALLKGSKDAQDQRDFEGRTGTGDRP